MPKSLSGPVVEGRVRRRWPWIFAPVVIVGLLAFSAVAAVWWVSAQMPRVAVEGLADGGQPLHILVVGNDSRAELSESERRELSTGHAEGERADTLFILSISGQQAAILAFPRDLWVERCDGSMGRINSAIAVNDGPGCLVRTVTSLSGIPVHHYLEMTFGGLRDVVDTVDGVPICLDQAIADRDAGIDLPAGCQRLDGADALGYVRVRKIDDDFQRILRQQQFVRSLAGELLASASPTRPISSLRIAGEVASSVTGDDGFGAFALVRMGWALRGLSSQEINGHLVPVTPRITSQGAYVLDPVVDEAAVLFRSFRDGSVFDQPPQEMP